MNCFNNTPKGLAQSFLATWIADQLDFRNTFKIMDRFISKYTFGLLSIMIGTYNHFQYLNNKTSGSYHSGWINSIKTSRMPYNEIQDGYFYSE